jgi:hypothetical protein
MGNLTSTLTHLQDPFAGYNPQPVSCKWLSEQDEKAARAAEVIRLIVDENRGHCGPWANDVYQRNFIREVQQFIGPTSAVLVTDAGSIKTYIQALSATMDSMRSGLTAFEQTLLRIELGQMELLLGVDGCICGRTTHLQTIVHFRSHRQVALRNTTVKLYPAPGEAGSLVGWRICEDLGHVPEELAIARRVETSVGTILVLVCHEAAIFSRRSFSNLRVPLKLSIREHFIRRSQTEPRPTYVLIATHWNSSKSGQAFRHAAKFLSEETNATVVTTTRAPRSELASAARRFDIIGPGKEKVATLLVSDTY